MNYGPYPGVVRDLHDGDTIHVDLDLGFGVQLDSHDLDGKPVISCRVFGSNAPELSTAAGKAALAYGQTLLKSGDHVTVVSHGYDKYGGRFDGAITLADGSDFAAQMIAAGHAVFWDGTGPKPVPPASK
jgi:endonuclease YncB( thermonuclease family)